MGWKPTGSVWHLLETKHFQGKWIREGFVVEELGGNVSSQLLTPAVWMAGDGGWYAVRLDFCGTRIKGELCPASRRFDGRN